MPVKVVLGPRCVSSALWLPSLAMTIKKEIIDRADQLRKHASNNLPSARTARGKKANKIKSSFKPFKGTDCNVRDNVYQNVKNGRLKTLADIRSAARNIKNKSFREPVIAKARKMAGL